MGEKTQQEMSEMCLSTPYLYILLSFSAMLSILLLLCTMG